MAHGSLHEGLALSQALASSVQAQALDAEACNQWGMNQFALIEAAGRKCAGSFAAGFRPAGKMVVLAGSGNNAADALVMLKTLILDGFAAPSECSVFTTRLTCGKAALTEAAAFIRKIGVPVHVWDAEKASIDLAQAAIVIDGISGTGLSGPLHGCALEMAEAIKAHKNIFTVSIDCPSGNFDGWRAGMPMLHADATLAIEPQKTCLYSPAARANAGIILPVTGIFPQALIEKYRSAELVSWESAAAKIPPVPQTAHKYERGLVEIRAGSAGAAGAALLAALGAQAAGAGLVRLIVDPSLYPAIAPACSGIMAVPGGSSADEGRFPPSAILLGPGWGKSEDRKLLFEKCLPLEKQGIPLILDADAIPLAKNITFNGNAILTPHTGEFSALTGIPKDEILSNTINIIKAFSAEKNATILFKSHVMYIASPDGRIGIVDGMNPQLASGGSGDALAGFCAAIAARWRAMAAGFFCGISTQMREINSFDGYGCACAAAALLIQAAKAEAVAGKFTDAADIAKAAAAIAGAAWLQTPGSYNER